MAKKCSAEEYQHYDMMDTDNTLTAVTEYSYWLWLFSFISAFLTLMMMATHLCLKVGFLYPKAILILLTCKKVLVNSYIISPFSNQ